MVRPSAATTAALALAAIVLTGSAASASVMLTANLTTAAEVPTPTTPSTSTGVLRPTPSGTATFVVNDAMTAMTMSVTVTNLDVTGSQTADPNDNLVAAHIHAGPTVTPTTTGPVVWGFFGSPFNDNNPNDMVLTPFTTGVGGTITGKWDAAEGNGTTLAAQLPNILGGHSYINFHTTQNGGGEIRGNIVPEPAAACLAVPALLLGLARRRRSAR